MDKELLKKYVTGEANAEERQIVVEWLDSSEEHVREYMTLHRLYDMSVMNQVQHKDFSSTEVDDADDDALVSRKRSFSIKIVRETIKIAAIIAILLGVRALYIHYSPKEVQMQTLFVPAGQRAELILPDSTKVWLNSHTRISYPLSFNSERREVKLDGEAYFSVAHNAEKPFVVQTKTFDVQVLGTEFNVFAYSESKEERIDLLKGSIELSGPAFGNKHLLMKPNQSVQIIDGVESGKTIADFDYFKWKEGLICFNRESVANIIKKLELYYDTNITVTNSGFLNEKYSGKFRVKDGIEQVLKVLQMELKFTYKKNDDTNSIVIN